MPGAHIYRCMCALPLLQVCGQPTNGVLQTMLRLTRGFQIRHSASPTQGLSILVGSVFLLEVQSAYFLCFWCSAFSHQQAIPQPSMPIFFCMWGNNMPRGIALLPRRIEAGMCVVHCTSCKLGHIKKYVIRIFLPATVLDRPAFACLIYIGLGFYMI